MSHGLTDRKAALADEQRAVDYAPILGMVCHSGRVLGAVPPKRSRGRLVLVVTSAFIAVVGLCGVTVAWRLGFFNSDGRFDDVDACEIMPDAAALAPLVLDGAREPIDPRPRTFLGLGDGDTRSECKWSSMPAGVDRPFRTVRVFAATYFATSDGSGPERASESLRIWHDNRVHRSAGLTSLDIGENAYGITDKATYGLILAHVEVFDIHAKFRISNVVVDVSARTHDQPGDEEKAQVEGLAKRVAARLLAGD